MSYRASNGLKYLLKSQKKRDEKKEKKLEEIMTENFPN